MGPGQAGPISCDGHGQGPSAKNWIVSSYTPSPFNLRVSLTQSAQSGALDALLNSHRVQRTDWEATITLLRAAQLEQAFDAWSVIA